MIHEVKNFKSNSRATFAADFKSDVCISLANTTSKIYVHPYRSCMAWTSTNEAHVERIWEKT